MTKPQKNKFTRKEREHIAREERDYIRFTRLADPASGDLTTQDQEWMLSKSVRYLAYMLALEDCYDNFTIRGARQGDHSIDWWKGWLRTLSEEDADTEALRIRVKVETQIIPWIDRQKGVV